jgi:ABC-type sugar transport system ATPase subunit
MSLKVAQHPGRGSACLHHFINEIFGIADRITVLKDGRRSPLSPLGVRKGEVISAMVGRTTGHIFVRPEHVIGEVVLRCGASPAAAS